MSTIRFANNSDIDQLTKLALQFASAAGEDSTEERIGELWLKYLNGNTYCVFVAEEAGKLTGFIVGYLYSNMLFTQERIASELVLWSVDKSLKTLRGLVDAFEAWAIFSGASIVEIASYGFIDKGFRLGKLYSRAGYTKTQEFYRKKLKR